MTLQHGNRVRKNGGEQVVRELQAADAVEMATAAPPRTKSDSAPTRST